MPLPLAPLHALVAAALVAGCGAPAGPARPSGLGVLSPNGAQLVAAGGGNLTGGDLVGADGGSLVAGRPAAPARPAR